MKVDERQKLLEFDHTNLSIGITADGSRCSVIPVPWEGAGNAYKMRLPDLYITPEDIDDTGIFSLIKKHTVVGCYIFTPMNNYGFLSEFKDLRDVYIRCGECFTDLSCIKSWDMLFVEKAHIASMTPLTSASGMHPYGKCLGLCNCVVDDMSPLISDELYFSELVVWNNKTDEDFNRWKAVHARIYRYHDITKNGKNN